MAERENILVRLGKLFQNQLVIRKTREGQLVVKDVNFMQSGLTSNFVDRYQKVMGSYNTSMGRYAAKQNAKNAFDVLYQHTLNLLIDKIGFYTLYL